MDISKRVWNTDQSWYYERVFSTKRRNKFRVYVRRNAYDFQSFASGFVYDEASHKWNHIVTLPFDQCHCKFLNYFQANVCAVDFAEDDKVITDELLQIVEG